MRLPFFALIALAAVTACEPSAPPGPSVPANETYATSLGVDLATFVKYDQTGNLYYKDLVVGTGANVSSGQTITTTYAGYLVDGSKFTDGTNSSFVLSDAGLITGWALGIPGMKVGGKRKLVIGSSWAFGAKGGPGIPSNATVIFDVEIKGVH